MAEGGIVRRLLLAVGVKSDREGFDKVQRAAEGVKKTLLGIVGAAAAVGGALAVTVKHFADEADAANDTAKALGLTVRAYTELRHAAKMGGVEEGAFNTGISKLTKNLEAARRGAGAAKEALRGVNLSDGKGGIVDLDTALDRIADRFAAIEDPVKKAAFAQRVFGAGGLSMVNVLERGSKGLREARQEAIDLGIAFDDEAAESAAALNDEIDRTWGTVKGLARSLAFDLMPKVRENVRAIRDWISRNREWINGKLDAAVNLVKNALDNAVPIAWAFAAALGAIAVAGIVSWANPVGLAVLAVAAAITLAFLAAEDLSYALDGDPNDSLVGSFANAVGAGEGLRSMLDELRPLVEEVGALIRDLGFGASEADGEVSGFAKTIRDLVSALSSEAFETVAAQIRNLTDGIRVIRAFATGDVGALAPVRERGRVESTVSGLPAGSRFAIGLAGRGLDYFTGTNVSDYLDPTPSRSSSGPSKSTSVSFGPVSVNADGLTSEEAAIVVRREIEVATRRALDYAGGGS